MMDSSKSFSWRRRDIFKEIANEKGFRSTYNAFINLQARPFEIIQIEQNSNED